MTTPGLVYTGYLAAGKSTAAEMVANKLGFESRDTDVGLRIQFGSFAIASMLRITPEVFRAHEAKVLRKLTAGEGRVVATGAGIVSLEAGRSALAEAQSRGFHVIYLRTDFDEAAKRILNDENSDRPLFKDASYIDRERIRYESLRPHYEATANHTIDASQSREQVRDEIVEYYRRLN